MTKQRDEISVSVKRTVFRVWATRETRQKLSRRIIRINDDGFTLHRMREQEATRWAGGSLSRCTLGGAPRHEIQRGPWVSRAHELCHLVMSGNGLTHRIDVGHVCFIAFDAIFKVFVLVWAVCERRKWLTLCNGLCRRRKGDSRRRALISIWLVSSLLIPTHTLSSFSLSRWLFLLSLIEMVQSSLWSPCLASLSHHKEDCRNGIPCREPWGSVSK